jgi:hypothetical protein
MVAKALFVRLEAKPGKEEEVASFLKAVWRLCNRNPPQLRGSAYVWDPPRLGSLTHFRMKQAGRRISPDELPLP